MFKIKSFELGEMVHHIIHIFLKIFRKTFFDSFALPRRRRNLIRVPFLMFIINIREIHKKLDDWRKERFNIKKKYYSRKNVCEKKNCSFLKIEPIFLMVQNFGFF